MTISQWSILWWSIKSGTIISSIPITQQRSSVPKFGCAHVPSEFQLPDHVLRSMIQQLKLTWYMGTPKFGYRGSWVPINTQIFTKAEILKDLIVKIETSNKPPPSCQKPEWSLDVLIHVGLILKTNARSITWNCLSYPVQEWNRPNKLSLRTFMMH